MEKTLFNNQIQNMSNYIMFEIKAKQIELTPMLKEKNRSPIALSMGAPVDPVPQFVINKTIEYLNIDSLHTYSTPKGELKFLNAVSKRMKDRFGVDIDPKSEVFSLIGSKEGIANLIKAIVNPTEIEEDKDIILTPNPGYASYSSMLKVAGAKSFGIELSEKNNYMPDLNLELEKLKNQGLNEKKIKALIINYPNNPLGCTCDLEYLQHCVDFCNKLGIILISDNAYCEMYYDKNYKPHSIFECKNAKDCAIELYSFSKSYAMTGWRLGFACGNSTIITMLAREKGTIDTGVFKVLQYAGADLLESREGQEYINAQNEKFKNKIQKFVNGLVSLGYDVKMPKTTFYLWVRIPDRFADSVDFCNQLLEKSGIVVVPGTAFSSNAKRYIRMSVVASDADLAEVIRRMKEDGFSYNE